MCWSYSARSSSRRPASAARMFSVSAAERVGRSGAARRVAPLVSAGLAIVAPLTAPADVGGAALLPIPAVFAVVFTELTGSAFVARVAVTLGVVVVAAAAFVPALVAAGLAGADLLAVDLLGTVLT